MPGERADVCGGCQVAGLAGAALALLVAAVPELLELLDDSPLPEADDVEAESPVPVDGVADELFEEPPRLSVL